MASQDYATPNKSIDAQALINDAPLSKYQWMIAIICFLIIFTDGIDTAAMGFIAPALAQDWGIDRSQLGPVMSAALGGMIIGAFSFWSDSGPFRSKSCFSCGNACVRWIYFGICLCNQLG